MTSLNSERYAFDRNDLNVRANFPRSAIRLCEFGAPFFAAYFHDAAIVRRTDALGDYSSLAHDRVHIGCLLSHVQLRSEPAPKQGEIEQGENCRTGQAGLP